MSLLLTSSALLAIPFLPSPTGLNLPPPPFFLTVSCSSNLFGADNKDQHVKLLDTSDVASTAKII